MDKAPKPLATRLPPEAHDRLVRILSQYRIKPSEFVREAVAVHIRLAETAPEKFSSVCAAIRADEGQFHSEELHAVQERSEALESTETPNDAVRAFAPASGPRSSPAPEDPSRQRPPAPRTNDTAPPGVQKEPTAADRSAAWIAEIVPAPTEAPVPTPFSDPRMFFDEQTADRIEHFQTMLQQMTEESYSFMSLCWRQLAHMRSTIIDHIHEAGQKVESGCATALAQIAAQIREHSDELADNVSKAAAPTHELLGQVRNELEAYEALLEQGRQIQRDMQHTTEHFNETVRPVKKALWKTPLLVSLISVAVLGAAAVWVSRANVHTRDWRNTAQNLNFLITDIYRDLPEKTQETVATFYGAHGIVPPHLQPDPSAP